MICLKLFFLLKTGSLKLRSLRNHVYKGTAFFVNKRYEDTMHSELRFQNFWYKIYTVYNTI